MDELSEFELLPDHEKVKIMKFYKLFSTVESVPLKSTGKQNTLDGWLLKSKCTTSHNSDSSAKTSEKNPTIAKNIETVPVSEKNSQKSEKNLRDSEKNLENSVQCFDLENLELRQDNTFKSAESPGFISNADTLNSENKSIPIENDQSITENNSISTVKIFDTETSEFRRDNKLIHDFVMKNPIVLVKRLDFPHIEEVNSSKTCSPDLNKSFYSNDESSQQIFLSSPDTDKTSKQTSNNDKNFNVEKASFEVGTPGSSSCSEKQREAYYKLKKLCLNHELDLDDIFQKPEFKEMIEKYKSTSGAILFLGSHKCTTTGKVEPTVHFHKSKKKLLEVLSALKTRNN